MIMIGLDPPELLGLVLVGGESRRMGTAKAYLDYGGGPQYQICEAVLKKFCRHVYFSASPKLTPPLPVAKDQKIDDVFVDPIGPLLGIISAFKRFPDNAFFVLACDLPYFSADHAAMLLSLRNPHKKASIFFVDDQAEPLCGIYEPTIFPDLMMALAENRYCLRNIVSSLMIEKLPLHDRHAIVNINHDYEFMNHAANNISKLITVFYYSSLRHETGLREEQIPTKAETLFDLFLEIKRKYSLTIEPHHLRFAKNDRLVLPNEALFDEDVVVFLPPVSGG
jgi:molybdenum cofactor guanylyltransferase